MRLDVGAIAKGYAVEMIARHLEEQGITGYVLNVGGNVRTLGVKGDGNPWIVGVENPDQESDEKYLAELALTDYSSVTSGDYPRYYLVGGVRYPHIIDPTTLMPTTAFTSVSVVTPSSADGDALSTALFCMSFEEGLALVESLPDTEVMWLFPNGERKYSSGYAGFFREKTEGHL
jgi:thiamine biosynthesis lipoprotein